MYKENKLIVYGEVLVIENFIVGGVILYITAAIFRINFAGIRAKIKLAAGAAMCGMFSLMMFTCISTMLAVICEGAFAFAVCAAVFGRDALWKKVIAFVFVTYFMGGMTMALLLITGNQGLYKVTGIYTGDMKGGFLAAFIALCLLTSKQIIRTITKRKFYCEHVFNVKLKAGDFVAEEKAFLDTGNGLVDPVLGRPVAVADGELWRMFEDGGVVKPERFCAVPYESIGARGILEAVRIDSIEIGERIVKNCVIARGEGSFSFEKKEAEGCRLLLSKDMT